MSGELIKVGKYDLKYNKILDIDIAELDIYRSTGLPAHMVKRKHFKYSKNVLLGVKLEKEGQYLYISTMYEVQESKLNRRLYSGRLKEMSVDNVKKI